MCNITLYFGLNVSCRKFQYLFSDVFAFFKNMCLVIFGHILCIALCTFYLFCLLGLVYLLEKQWYFLTVRYIALLLPYFELRWLGCRSWNAPSLTVISAGRVKWLNYAVVLLPNVWAVLKFRLNSWLSSLEDMIIWKVYIYHL